MVCGVVCEAGAIVIAIFNPINIAIPIIVQRLDGDEGWIGGEG